jgi:hypothetical protein
MLLVIGAAKVVQFIKTASFQLEKFICCFNLLVLNTMQTFYSF